MSCVTAVDATWLADLGAVFYSVKQKGYNTKLKRTTELEFNKKVEIEQQMAIDREKAAVRAKEEEEKKIRKPVVKKVSAVGAVRKPIVPKRRGF
jgi:pre-mRNA-splicing factor ATP-dependent RNA helicase DHX38/PRP16